MFKDHTEQTRRAVDDAKRRLEKSMRTSITAFARAHNVKFFDNGMSWGFRRDGTLVEDDPEFDKVTEWYVALCDDYDVSLYGEGY